MPLEGPFIELVSTLAKEGTIIAAIIPNTHLTTKGNASRAIRTMLLNDSCCTLARSLPRPVLPPIVINVPPVASMLIISI